MGHPRLKNYAILALILTFLSLYYFLSPGADPSLRYPVKPFKLDQRRSTFQNAIYTSWTALPSHYASLDSTCENYLKRLLSYLPHRALPNFEQVLKTEFPLLLYQKKKWIAEEKKHYRRRLKAQGIRFDESHMEELEKLYYQLLHQLSSFEEGFVDDMNHLRVFGKCLMDSQCPILNKDVSFNAIVKQLLPWFLGRMPSVDRKLASASHKNVIALVRESLKGKGIVIPLLPQHEKSVQLRNTVSLIHILRAMGNKLPIEIVYVGENYINDEAARSIQAAGKDTVDFALDSRNKYLTTNSLDSSVLEMPTQDIRLINVKPTINEGVNISDSLMLALSSIFNSFEEMMVISAKTIPLMKDLLELFENSMYKEHGTLFFKHRALLDFKPHKSSQGSLEVKDLLNNYAVVNDFDKSFFDIHAPEVLHTQRVRYKGYTKLLDPSLMVINKSKTLPGLLISSALPFYGVLSAAYDFSDKLNAEFMWLGQEISGRVKMVNFNWHFAVAAGILTPPENVPTDFSSQELCSSSWAQLYDDRYTLVYTTSHQSDNRVLPAFMSELRTKYTVDGSKKGETGNSEVNPKIDQVMISIQSVLLPIEFEEPRFNMDGLKTMSWDHLDKFGSVGDYWCAYDVVGNVNLQNRGLVIDYGAPMSSWYMFLMDTWVQSQA